ncbi:MAG: ACT domain-containing protein [Fervidicoccaceae archaeon]
MERGREKRAEEHVGKIPIAEVVRKIIDLNIPLLECLRMGVVNYTWASEKIMSEVLKLSGRKRVNVDAIKAALIRYHDELKNEAEIERKSVIEVLARSSIELQDDITVITIRRHAAEQLMPDLLRLASESRFFSLVESKRFYTVTISSEDASKIVRKLSEEEVLEQLTGQSIIVLISPHEITTTPGVISHISRHLFNRGINITQVISSYTDTMIVVSRDQAIKALEALQEIVESCRKLVSAHASRTSTARSSQT